MKRNYHDLNETESKICFEGHRMFSNLIEVETSEFRAVVGKYGFWPEDMSVLLINRGNQPTHVLFNTVSVWF